MSRVAGLVGVIAMGLAIGIAELLAAFGEWIGIFNTPASPLYSLGQTFIQFTPEWLKEFAIRTFGENDKAALTAGMGITLFLVALVIGIVGRQQSADRRGITVRADPGHRRRRSSAEPGRIARRPPDPARRCGRGLLPGHGLPAAGRRPVAAADPAPGATRARADKPGPEQSSANRIRTTRRPRMTGASHPMGRADAGRAAARSIGGSSSRSPASAPLVAVAAGALANWIPSAADVAASRAGVALPTPADVQKVGDVRRCSVDGITPFVTSQRRLLPGRHRIRGARG